MDLAKEISISKSFSGLWEGESVSRAGDCTRWANTFLLFLPFEKGKLIVEGRGISEWRGQHIVFLISGEVVFSDNLDDTEPWPRLCFTLRKQHTGKFTNSLNFMGTLDAPVQGSQCSLQGQYQHGLLALRRIGDVRSLVRCWCCIVRILFFKRKMFLLK
jgi:hypothetical protein